MSRFAFPAVVLGTGEALRTSSFDDDHGVKYHAGCGAICRAVLAEFGRPDGEPEGLIG